MSLRGYRLNQRAVEDLEEIWVYTFQNWSVNQADRYIQSILDEIQRIADKQVEGRSADHIRTGYLIRNIESHIIFYRKGEMIEVMRILHNRMDVGRHLDI